jgi:hypothetical protein
MAQRTISPAGGNFGSASAWVEGIVPTSGDNVVGITTSGSITMEANRSILRIDLTNYAATWSYAGRTLNLVQTGVSSNFWGVNTKTDNTGLLFLSAGAAVYTLYHYGTYSIGNLSSNSTNAQITLATDIYVNDMINQNVNVRWNGVTRTIYVRGNFRNNSETSTTQLVTAPQSFLGSALADLIGEGYISTNLGDGSNQGRLRISGSYSSRFNPFRVLQNTTLEVATAANVSNLDLTFWNTSNGTGVFTASISSPPRNVLVYQTAKTVQGSTDLNLTSTLVANNFGSYPLLLSNVTASFYDNIRFLGTGGFSFSSFSLYPTFSLIQAQGLQPYRSPNIQLAPGTIYNIGRFQAIGNADNKSTISSSSPGTQSTINITGTNAVVTNYNFTDITATGQTIYALNSTLSNTTNIKATASIDNVNPTGFAFVS